MTIDVYTATGTKKGTATLPKDLFEAPINEGLMHQAVVRHQGNRRTVVAHTKGRGEIQGSTRKLFAQKGTGRARRGSVRSPLLRGGNKAFGPLKNANYRKDMPKKMRWAALKSCLSMQAQNKKIIGLENYSDNVKTKDMMKLLEKLPVDIGRKILFVTPQHHQALVLSARNIPKVKAIQVSGLNVEDVLGAWHIIFVVDALKVAEELFSSKEKKQMKQMKQKSSGDSDTKKVASKTKRSSVSSGSSVSSDSSK
ncbi:MAG: 50S ribosomal protein L4 [Candidatus Peribacteraceae bacterium]|jgi:large subunit ribosomal protein L4|nr:50S ribosomal protein L4 [Candidatus Peribacteraceae bacterium]HCI03961.1 50S ribosomal protein L4 [Candidatus Peribacteria bacterium]|tara:strand:+ start:841 stop:1599 length:759 start_codon:yes stop_codon:yes gene_type:complete